MAKNRAGKFLGNFLANFSLNHLVPLFCQNRDDELVKIVDEAWNEAWNIIVEEEGWKDEKKGDHGDVVKSKKNKKGRNFFLDVSILGIGDYSKRAQIDSLRWWQAGDVTVNFVSAS